MLSCDGGPYNLGLRRSSYSDPCIWYHVADLPTAISHGHADQHANTAAHQLRLRHLPRLHETNTPTPLPIRSPHPLLTRSNRCAYTNDLRLLRRSRSGTVIRLRHLPRQHQRRLQHADGDQHAYPYADGDATRLHQRQLPRLTPSPTSDANVPTRATPTPTD